MGTPAWAGLDLGTSGCRLVVIDARRRVLHRAAVPLPASHIDGDGVEQHPQDWWRAVETLLGALPEDLHLRAIAVDGTSGSVLAIDAAGTPLTPALMYDDSRARDEAAMIARVAPPDSPANSLTSGLARALWLSRRHPEAAAFVHQADWIAGRLAARHRHGDASNALKMGYDAEHGWPDWVGGLIALERLPRIAPPGAPLGPVTEAVAAWPGFDADTRVILGCTDSTASALVACAGRLEPGTGISVLGSTLAVKLVTRRPWFDGARGVYSHRVSDLWLTGGASNSGGAVLAHYFDPQRITALSRDIDPTRPAPLDYYPLLRPGERFPVADPDLPPRLSPRPADDGAFLHGLLEGIAAIEQQAYHLLAGHCDTPLRRVVTIGGGAANPAWRAIRARRLGVPIEQPAHDEAAFGTAWIAQGMRQQSE